MAGSWSIKAVLPTVAPELNYDSLSGIAEGSAAADAYIEAIREGTCEERRQEIRQQLLDYCALDSLAMVRLARFFAG